MDMWPTSGDSFSSTIRRSGDLEPRHITATLNAGGGPAGWSAVGMPVLLCTATPRLAREDMPANPMSPMRCRSSSASISPDVTRLYGFSAVTIRYFNVFGPRQDPGSPYSGVISRFTAALLDGERPVIHGDGEQTRGFTYVASVVDGVLRACEAPQAAGEVINVATGGRISLNELLRVLNRLNGSNLQPIYKASRAGDVRDSQADIAKAKTLLGYEPIVFLEDGLKRTLNWCRTSFSTERDRQLKIA